MGVIIRQGFKAALSNYIGMGLGFLSLFILLPLFYTPEKLGAVRLFIELGTVLSSFALIGTHYSINRFFPFFKTADEKHHAPNEFMRIRRLREGMRAWEVLWRLLADGPHKLEIVGK